MDLETKASLQETPPEKLAPATTETYGVVVLAWLSQPGNARTVRAFDRVLQSSQDDAKLQSTRQPPFVAKRGLALPDALLAQFELICCDIVSVFISDIVLSDAGDAYLFELYSTLLTSNEFAMETIRVDCIPNDSLGIAFLDQFLGVEISSLPYEMIAAQKKARIMRHWATKIGAIVTTVPS